MVSTECLCLQPLFTVCSTADHKPCCFHLISSRCGTIEKKKANTPRLCKTVFPASMCCLHVVKKKQCKEFRVRRFNQGDFPLVSFVPKSQHFSFTASGDENWATYLQSFNTSIT